MSKLLVGFFLILSLHEIAAQCNPPDQLPTSYCENAPQICLLNACYQTLDEPAEGPSGWCFGNNSIQNPQYFLFYATSNFVEIHIYVNSCSGSGLQAGILNDCPWSPGNVLSCNGGTNPGGTIVLSSYNLNPGIPYWLMIDGESGAHCNYTITYTDNIYDPLFENDLEGGAASPVNVCLGADSLLVEAYPPVGLAHGYYWVPSWSGDTIYSTLSSTTIPVPSDINPGTYEICVSAFSGCDLSSTVCFHVNVLETLYGELDPIILCTEEFPITWGDLIIEGAGEYIRSFNDAGCEYDSLWVVESYPVPEFVIIDTMHCVPFGGFTYYYDNQPFDQSGTYPLFYSKADINQCDSLAQLNLLSIGINAYTEASCDTGLFSLTTIVEEVMPFTADIEFYWFDPSTSEMIFEGNPFVTSSPGCYDLIIHVETSEFYCEYFLENQCIEGMDYYPSTPLLPFQDTVICRNQIIQFCVGQDPQSEPVVEYIWTAPPNAIIIQNGLACTTIDFSNSSGGQVCVQAIGECGGDPPACFNVGLLPQPSAMFISNSSVCINDTVTIIFSGVASPLATFNWDFGSPAYLSGSGAGPYHVIWSTEALHAIEISVIEQGCDTSTYTGSVSVEQLLPPVVNCSTTINSIDFDWPDVPGVSGYLVSVNGGATVPISQSDTLISMLSPGTSVDLILTTLSNGPCPNVSDTITCVAQNCPAPTIELNGEDTICLNMPMIIDLEAVVNGMSGEGTWSGLGIIDSVEGLFDPTLSGSGVHVLQYIVFENECVFLNDYIITVFDSLTADFYIDPLVCVFDSALLTYLGNAHPGASYQYSFDGAAIHQGSDAGPYLLSWIDQGPKTISLQVEENGCVSDIVTQTIMISDSLEAPIVHCVQSLNGVMFSWEIDSSANGNIANTLSGQSGILNGNSYTFDGLNEGDLVELELITQTLGPCPERKDTFECIAKDCPDVLLSITGLNDICLYPNTENITLVVEVQNGNGSGFWSGSGVIDPIVGIFDPHVAGVGSHIVSYLHHDEDCDFFESISINVTAIPQAIISNTQLILTCASGSIFLDGTNSTGDSLQYIWTTSTGTIAGSTETSTAEVTQPGIYQLSVISVGSGCKDSVSVTVDQDSAMPIADAGIDQNMTCDFTNLTLGGNSSTGNSIVYSWSTIDGNIIGLINTSSVEVDQPGIYSLSVMDTVTGCQSFDEVLVEIDTTVIPFVLFPGDTIDCNTDSSVITSSLNEPLDDYQFEWSYLDEPVEVGHHLPTLTVSKGGVYTLTTRNLLNGCESSASIMVVEREDRIEDILVVHNNISCFGYKDGSIAIVNVIGGQPEYTYAWSIDSNVDTAIIGLSAGIYTLTVTDSKGCVYSKQYYITEPDLVTIDLGPDRIATEGDIVRIEMSTSVIGSSIGTIEWSTDHGIICEGCTTIEFEAVSDGFIVASITDTAGCSAYDTMMLTILLPRYYYSPNIFSPNNDGLNDYFTIYGRSNLTTINALRIFDRWGNMVFEDFNLTPGAPFSGRQI
jgi:hypothetical protein